MDAGCGGSSWLSRSPSARWRPWASSSHRSPVGAFVAAIAPRRRGALGSIVAFVVDHRAAVRCSCGRSRARHLHQPPQLAHRHRRADRASAIVLERIANDEGVGCVKIDGEVWTARAYDEDDVIEAGKRVQVIEIRGATALVSE